MHSNSNGRWFIDYKVGQIRIINYNWLTEQELICLLKVKVLLYNIFRLVCIALVPTLWKLAMLLMKKSFGYRHSHSWTAYIISSFIAQTFFCEDSLLGAKEVTVCQCKVHLCGGFVWRMWDKVPLHFWIVAMEQAAMYGCSWCSCSCSWWQSSLSCQGVLSNIQQYLFYDNSWGNSCAVLLQSSREAGLNFPVCHGFHFFSVLRPCMTPLHWRKFTLRYE